MTQRYHHAHPYTKEVQGIISDVGDGLFHEDFVRLDNAAVKATEAAKDVEEERDLLRQIVEDYANHDSWRCDYYKECHCGLNDARVKAGLEPWEPWK